MSVCKNCKKNKPDEFFECCSCGEYVHPRCLKTCTVPGGLLGDVFFVYTCEKCSINGVEHLERDKMSWVDVVLLTLYNLTELHSHQSFKGYFHCNQHIKRFVNSEWKTIFPHMRTKRKSWKQMITATLKSYTPEYFSCGDGMLEFPSTLTGWYKLARPDILPNHALMERKGKRKKRKLDSEQPQFVYQSDNSVWGENSCQDSDQNSTRVNPLLMFCNESSTSQENMYSRSYVKPTASLSEYLFAEEDKSDEIDIDVTDSDSIVDIRCKESCESPLIFQKSQNANSKNSGSETSNIGIKIKEEPPNDEEESTADQDWKSETGYETNFSVVSNSLFVKNDNPSYKPWRKYPRFSWNCTPMNEQEEFYLMSNLWRKISEANEVSVADIRLHRKLKLRRLKRERNLSVFDPQSPNQTSWIRSGDYRVLDRYQFQTVVTSFDDDKLNSFRTRLMGHTEQYSCFVSPFTQRVLKPFIRRDYESTPLWLKLLGEMQKEVNKKDLNWTPPPRAPIDYSYVRPHHIPAINSLAQQYFWPGINLTECLQYPDFSCVVLYKKLIVAFAFLVPDVTCNEAYVSFIFTRPEWRRAGIGTFMLYHLIQTCMGRDITLHVSATNPALLLYQKFGFKVEEFVQDFYEKYLPIDSNECKHALFLRLSR
ncbi:UNVERIFIED_CONTAM: hypothetical protein PYX00_000622 [Menopon gallinae]|uniref:N-acetyltransferase domain-containing protein n=1 Tax=Menopon gallinae TaxID=328185 RepID=A0AAW2IBA5_9NEOP